MRFFIIFICIMSINSAHASWCGVLQDIYYDGALHYLKPSQDMPAPYDDGTYDDFLVFCDYPFDDEEIGLAEICVNYDYIEADNDTIYLRNCVVQDRYCLTDSMIQGLTCVKCPTGWAADTMDDSLHTNNQCPFCATNYYHDSYEDCFPCPEGGVTYGPDSALEDCLLQKGTVSANDNGAFMIIGGDCYWNTD